MVTLPTSAHRTLPATDLVILNAGQARRMQGQDKLLQVFDTTSQLDKIVHHFHQQVEQIWVNSPRDSSIYQSHYPELAVYADHQAGYWGPVMGMLSAWSHVQTDYVLFIPADITYIATDLLTLLHQRLVQYPAAEVVYVVINQQAVYPLCLMQRRSQSTLAKQLELHQYSIQASFAQLHVQSLEIESPYRLHSINSFEELAEHRLELWAMQHDHALEKRSNTQ